MTPAEFADDTLLRQVWGHARQWRANGLCRFTMTEGRRVYEMPADPRHDAASEAVLRSVACLPPASLVARGGIYIAFDEWSLLCPDVAVWDAAPDDGETPVTLHPQAVVEVLHPKSRGKDLIFGVPFYLRVGIQDILIVDPDAGQTYHFRPGEPERNYQSPHTLTLACGCQITV